MNPAIERDNREVPPARCRICNCESLPLASARVLYRYDVTYFRCTQCGFTQTEEPYWLAEAYSHAIARLDVGSVRRNVLSARVTAGVIEAYFDWKSRFLDFGGGHGLFVRLMRDAGYDFRWQDKFADNVYARGFEAAPKGTERYGMVTAFEVFEHLVSPVEGVEEMLAYAPSLLFTTDLMPSRSPLPNEWWYYTLPTGQHVSLFTKRSLEILAERFGLRLHTNGALHLFAPHGMTVRGFRLRSKYRVASLHAVLHSRPTLIDRDFEAMGREIAKA